MKFHVEHDETDDCKITIRGPSSPLKGRSSAPGCKNSAMPSLIAAALAKRGAAIGRVPDIADIRALLKILESVGVRGLKENGRVIFEPQVPTREHIPDDLSRSLRGSVYALAIPVVHFGRGGIGEIGGDSLVGRTLQPHARAFAGFGMELRRVTKGWEVLGGRPKPSEFHLNERYAGVSATCLAVLIASSLKGESIIHEASTEPEVHDLLACVRAFGASAEVDETSLIIKGPLTGGNVTYDLPIDHIYCGTMAIAVALTGGRIEMPVEILHRMAPVFEVLSAAGVSISVRPASLEVCGAASKPVVVATGTYPKFPTDLLPQMMALLTQVPGRSTLVENIYQHRFDQAGGLTRMGADISVCDNRAIVSGPTPLRGADVRGGGIRESTSLVLAGLAAAGVTTVHDAAAVYRGYEDLIGELSGMGAQAEVSWGRP